VGRVLPGSGQKEKTALSARLEYQFFKLQKPSYVTFEGGEIALHPAVFEEWAR
jgi:hypothetical protein